MEYRVIFAEPEGQERAIVLLEEEGIDFDFDSGDRMMLDQEGLDFLYNTDIDFDEV